jgi:hypothetical protein
LQTDIIELLYSYNIYCHNTRILENLILNTKVTQAGDLIEKKLAAIKIEIKQKSIKKYFHQTNLL